MGSICASCISNPVDNEFTNEMQKIIDEHVALIPVQYTVEQKRIADEMRQVSPQRYQGLLWEDFPEKNEPQVKALARKNVTSDQVKHQIAHQVKERLEPTIESKMANMNPCARCIAMCVIDTAITVAVAQAVNTIIPKNDNTPTTAT